MRHYNSGEYYSSQNVRGQNRYSALSSVKFPLSVVSLSPRVMAYRFMIMFNTKYISIITHAHICSTQLSSHLCSCLSRWASMAACLSHVPHPKLQWLHCGYCRARARRPCLMGTASGFIRACSASIASCKALIRLKVQRLIFVRPSARTARGKIHQNVL